MPGSVIVRTPVSRVAPPQDGARPAERPPTIKDVADRARVSKSVVSRVMRGAGTVSRESRDAVLAAAEELSYRPNAAARSLVQRRSFNVGVLASDLHNPFFAEIIDGIAAAAAAAGYQMLIATGNRDRDAEAHALETLLELRADGVILLSPAGAAPGRTCLQICAGAVVAIMMRVPGVDVVVNDDVRGAELAVRHLAGLGHRRIAMVDGGAGAGAAERRSGYEAAMTMLGLGDLIQVATGDCTEEGGYSGAQLLLRRNPRPTAIFAGNDLAAVGALNALEEPGLEVPADVSLVGYDNTALASLRHISLTTVHQPRRQIGEMAMKAVLRRIQRNRARAKRLVLEPHLVPRQTTAPPGM